LNSSSSISPRAPIRNALAATLSFGLLLAASPATGQEAEFLRQGQFNAVGYGGSLMLDYEHHRETYEIDVETRLSNIWLQSTRGCPPENRTDGKPRTNNSSTG
jgi:hypothetical protein